MLATDNTHTFAIFLYDTLQWTTGDASGGSSGLGGTVARAGINAGDAARSVTMPGSGNQARMLGLVSGTNIFVTGVYVLSPTGMGCLCALLLIELLLCNCTCFSISAVLYTCGGANLGPTDDGSQQISFSAPFCGRTLTTANVGAIFYFANPMMSILL